MKLLLFITPNEFKDESLSLFKLFFDKWHVDYAITSYSTKECVGTHGAIYMPSINTNKVFVDDYEGIVIIDGDGIERYRLYEFRPFLDLILKFNDKGKGIVAINNAVKVLARANIIKGRRLSTPDDQEARRLILLFHGIPSEQNMEVADNLITIKDYSGLEGSMQAILARMGVT